MVLADYSRVDEFLQNQRTGRQNNGAPRPPPQRRLRPLKKRPAVPKPVPEQIGAGSDRFSTFGLNPNEYKNNFAQRPTFKPVKFPKFPNFGKRPNFKPIKFPKFPNFGGGGGGGGYGSFHSGGGGGRVGVGHTNSPFGYLGNLLRAMSYLVS